MSTDPIPRDELPEVLGTIVDDDGRRQVLERGPLQHDSLSIEQIERIAAVRDALARAYPMTLDGWVDGFLRETDPESELQVVEACAAVYQRLASAAQLTQEESEQLYGVVCALSAGGGPDLGAFIPVNKGLPNVAILAGMLFEAHRSRARPSGNSG